MVAVTSQGLMRVDGYKCSHSGNERAKAITINPRTFLICISPQEQSHYTTRRPRIAANVCVRRVWLPRLLKSGGVLFSSNPRGNNEEGWNGGRYGAYHDLDTWRSYVSAAGFSELVHYYRPAGLPLDKQPWLASVWRR
jgi:hypothetical protein